MMTQRTSTRDIILLLLMPDRAGAGYVFFNRGRIPGVNNFARTGDRDLQRVAYGYVCVSCPGCREFGGFRFHRARLPLTSTRSVRRQLIVPSLPADQPLG